MISVLAISGCTEKTNSNISMSQIQSTNVEITSQNLAYPAYFAQPAEAGKKPAIVLIHSYLGLEPGYRTLTDNLAKEGYVVISPEWQTFNKSPADEVLQGLIKDSIAYLKTSRMPKSQDVGDQPNRGQRSPPSRHTRDRRMRADAIRSSGRVRRESAAEAANPRRGPDRS